MGLHCITIGSVGDDIYGRFLLNVLRDEGIRVVQINGFNCDVNGTSAVCETFKCWVFVDPFQRHDFWSCNKAHAFSSKLTREVKMSIKQSKILVYGGYIFYELPLCLIVSALEYAVEVGTLIFFDPGPKGKRLATGTPEAQNALDKFLRMSDVLLLTSEEAESLTGIRNPILAGQELVKKGVRTKWVIVKMGSKGSVWITESTISCAPAFKVNVVDTVGCGDSFTAAIAFGYLRNLPVVHTLALANAVGAATAMSCGAGRNVAALDKVKDIMRESNLHEVEKFWDEFFDENVDDKVIEFLSNIVVNGSNNRFNHVSLQKVVSEVLPKLESSPLRG